MIEHDGCKGCKYEKESADSKNCVGCVQNAIDKYSKMTNCDMIKNMTDKELSEYICGIIDVGKDKFINGTIIPNYDKNSINEWLNSEVSE